MATTLYQKLLTLLKKELPATDSGELESIATELSELPGLYGFRLRFTWEQLAAVFEPMDICQDKDLVDKIYQLLLSSLPDWVTVDPVENIQAAATCTRDGYCLALVGEDGKLSMSTMEPCLPFFMFYLNHGKLKFRKFTITEVSGDEVLHLPEKQLLIITQSQSTECEVYRYQMFRNPDVSLP